LSLLAVTDAQVLIGVPIIMVDSGVNSEAPLASIATDNYDGAFQIGKVLACFIGGKDKIINLVITTGLQTGCEQDDDFLAAI
jgi:ribose transport system substrate-binding protein